MILKLIIYVNKNLNFFKIYFKIKSLTCNKIQNLIYSICNNCQQHNASLNISAFSNSAIIANPIEAQLINLKNVSLFTFYFCDL